MFLQVYVSHSVQREERGVGLGVCLTEVPSGQRPAGQRPTLDRYLLYSKERAV